MEIEPKDFECFTKMYFPAFSKGEREWRWAAGTSSKNNNKKESVAQMHESLWWVWEREREEVEWGEKKKIGDREIKEKLLSCYAKKVC